MAVDFDKVNSYLKGIEEKIQPRDNTRVNNKLEPKLKKEENKLPDNRTYLSQSPSKEIIDANKLNHTLKQIQNFGESLKQVGLDLRDYAAVGTSMLNPVAGMALGLGDAGISTVNGDYVSGGIQAGLEMLPYAGPIVKRGVKNGVKTYGTKIFNLTEDITPKWSEKFHTWNAKDNINNMTAEQVINNKKSRLKTIQPDYSKDWERVKSDPFNDPWEAERIINRDFPPKNVRNKKIDDVRKADEIEIMENTVGEGGSKERFYYNENIDPNIRHNYIFRDVGNSFNRGSIIHVGDLKMNNNLEFKSIKPFTKGSVYAHELDHAAGNPTKKEFEQLQKLLNLKSFSGDYVTNPYNHGSEMKARLGQLKDLFDLSRNNKISKSQLKSAINLYQYPNKYGIIDNMTTRGLDFNLKLLTYPQNKDKLKALRDFMNVTSLRKGGKI